MEYLLVHCPEPRTVTVDGTPQGQTEELIELAAGTYTIRLEPPTRCVPPSITVVLANTSVLRPCEVSFGLA